MNDLDKLLQSYTPPPAPQGLAERAAAAAVKLPQGKQARVSSWSRRDRRGRWKRPLLIGSATFGLAFTSAVAATVASDGRIEIPVVREVVAAAAPILNIQPPAKSVRSGGSARDRRIEGLAAKAQVRKPAPGDAMQLPDRDQRVAGALADAKQRVEERRAAGLPTPRADRIERRAERIVERRQAAGKPVPPVEQVESILAARELQRLAQRRAQFLDPSAITQAQVQRFADRLPYRQRERFLSLSPEQQRMLVARVIQRVQMRRALRQQGAVQPPQDRSEGFLEPVR